MLVHGQNIGYILNFVIPKMVSTNLQVKKCISILTGLPMDKLWLMNTNDDDKANDEDPYEIFHCRIEIVCR